MRGRSRTALLGALVAAAGIGVGVWIGRGSAPAASTRTVTAPAAAASASSLPPAVTRTRRRLLAAARSRDWAALGRLASGHGFSFTFGDPSGGPVAYWRALESSGGKPLETLVALLRMPSTLAGDLYVWPFAYDRDPAGLTAYEKRLLAPIADEQAIRDWIGYGSYTGYRTAIAPDGAWRYFIRGD
ncbi:MAG TPA: hypothetical protein VFJ91_04875 [Gaiellaceae bacterium]|nr:hypothetical protein [Gaiellaceae bacterium]